MIFGLKPEAADFFSPFLQCSDGRLVFNFGATAKEYWSAAMHRVPATHEIWLANAAYPNLITDLYIGYSAADLLCFTSQRPQGLSRHPEQRAYAALGLLPTAQQVNRLKTLFPIARWHLLFTPDLLGKVADASIAAWFKANRVSFRLTGNRLTARYRDRLLQFEPDSFSLHRFELATGMRSGIRTYKPPRGYLSFIDLQKTNSHDT